MDINYYPAPTDGSPPCWELVSLVYSRELNTGVAEFKTVDSSVRAIASEFRLQLHKGAHGFQRISHPQDFCVVLMGRHERTGPHHCGVFFGGRVLHATSSGVAYQDLASIQDTYRLVEFWAK